MFSTVLIWINPVYFGKEGDTVALTVYREGYLGSSSETISKSGSNFTKVKKYIYDSFTLHMKDFRTSCLGLRFDLQVIQITRKTYSYVVE